MEAKFPEIVQIIERRLSEGDYYHRPIPSGRKLAADVGVSYLTARRAIRELLQKGVLVRLANGRVQANPAHSNIGMKLAFLAPAFSSNVIQRVRISLEQAASSFAPPHAVIRPVDFVHWDDPVVSETLANFDGIFLLPSSEPVPPHVIRNLQSNINPVVVLTVDWTAQDLASVEFFSPAAINGLLDHLAELGHRRIACLNISHDAETDRRAALWRQWLHKHQSSGRLIQTAVESYTHPTPQAYALMAKTLADKTFKDSAVLCTTFAAAVGACRAAYEQRLEVGRDFSICAIDGEGMSRFHTPSITSLEITDLQKSMNSFMKYLSWRRKKTGTPVSLHPPTVELFKGETTGEKS